MKRPFVLAAGLLWAGLLLLPGAGLAAEAGAIPTKITSARMAYDSSGQAVSFEGDVLVSRPDLEIRAGRITVHFSPRAAGRAQAPAGTPGLEAGQIEKIVAQGDVRISREGREGRCQTATYLIREGLLRMEGAPTLKDGQNQISGEVIRLYLKDNRSEVIGGPERRVEAIFFTPRGLQAP